MTVHVLQAETDMACFVLVHGGGHGGWCYAKVAALLRAAGHDVYTPTLTGLGERKHLLTVDTDLSTHVTDIVNTLIYEDLRDVLLVGHSYGGMVITGVADRAPNASASWSIWMRRIPATASRWSTPRRRRWRSRGRRHGSSTVSNSRCGRPRR